MDLVDNYSFSVIQCYWIRAASSELICSVCCPLCTKYILDFVLLVLFFCIREINSSFFYQEEEHIREASLLRQRD